MSIIAQLRIAAGEGRVLPPNRSDAETSSREVSLPADHHELLRSWGPVVTSDRLARLRDVSSQGAFEGISEWNEKSRWKCAWRLTQVEQFLCFGETAWGDQFAYRIEDLRAGGTPPVYELATGTMEIRYAAESFAEFIHVGLLLHLNDPDEYTRLAWQRHDDIRVDQQIAWIPPGLIGGQELDHETMLLPAAEHMVLLGDLHTQIFSATPGALIEGFEVAEDEDGRQRAKVDIR